MKFILSTCFLATFFFCTLSLRAEDWTTISGKFYPQVKVVKVEADAVTILYRDGGALIPLILLPDDLQKKFHYDAAVAKAAADARDRADLENARALRAEYDEIIARNAASHSGYMADSSEEAVEVSQAADTDPSHYSENDLVDPTHRLMDDVSYENHHSMSSLVPGGSVGTSPSDASHHSTGSLFGSGDPLSQ